MLKICQQRARVRLCEAMPKLSQQEAQFLVKDWHSAHSRLLLELEFKLITGNCCLGNCVAFPAVR